MLDCLRWWVEAMHVDGFRFDLAPVLGRKQPASTATRRFLHRARRRPGARRPQADRRAVGRRARTATSSASFPAGWSEWNDRYRDTVRAFWRGERRCRANSPSGSPARATCSGSAAAARRRAINFITAHDGFTLADLVSYNERHNLANREDNPTARDNLSWNCGVEGPTDDPAVLALRDRQMREPARDAARSRRACRCCRPATSSRARQRGNNNAYCQDNETQLARLVGGARADAT